MKRIFCLLLLLIPFCVKAQSEKGIRFETNLSWRQIKAKAKAENKYIFVDCYATWCGPCKAMDKQIYPNDTVGQIMNDKFISVKVQMDTATQDNEFIKSWYTDAHWLEEEYHITAFPSFLYFSPDGKPIHKDEGFKGNKDFIKLTKEVFDPTKQYYSLLAKFNSGILTPDEIKDLAFAARKHKDADLAVTIARSFIKNNMNQMSEIDFYTRSNMDFIANFLKTVRTSDRIFKETYSHPERIDSAATFKYAEGWKQSIITNEEARPLVDEALARNSEPNWVTIYKRIESKYSKLYADLILSNSKSSYYQFKKDWKNHVKYLIEARTISLKNGFLKPNNFITINGMAMDVFDHSSDKNELQTALEWIDLTLENSKSISKSLYANLLDTKAGILYKMGKVKEAVEIEEGVVAEYPDFKENLARMKKGLPTWQQLGK